MFFLLTGAIIEVGTLKIARVLAQQVGSDTWLVPPVLFVFASVSFIFFYLLGVRFPDQSLFEYGPRLVGRVPAQILNAVLISYWLLVAGRILREFADILKITLLDVTPTEVILITLLVTAAHLARHGLEPLSRVTVIVVLASVPIGIGLVSLTFLNAYFEDLFPVLTEGPMPILKAGLFHVGNVEQLSALLLLFPFLAQPRGALKAGIGALVVSLLVGVWITVTSTQAVYDIAELTHLRMPALTAIQTVELPVIFLERLSSVYVTNWITQAFITVSFTVWLVATGLQQWFRRQSHCGFVLPLLPVIYVIALSPSNLESLETFAKILTTWGMAIQLPLPMVLYVLSLVRNIKGGEVME